MIFNKRAMHCKSAMYDIFNRRYSCSLLLTGPKNLARLHMSVPSHCLDMGVHCSNNLG